MPEDQSTLKHVELTGKIKHPLIKKFFKSHKTKNEIKIIFNFIFKNLFKSFQLNKNNIIIGSKTTPIYDILITTQIDELNIKRLNISLFFSSKNFNIK